jgi:hypothetical protein
VALPFLREGTNFLREGRDGLRADHLKIFMQQPNWNPEQPNPNQPPPTINEALTWLKSQPCVSVEDVTTCLSTVMFRNPEGGFILSDVIGGQQVYRKMTATEVLAEMRDAKDKVRMLVTVERKMSNLLKKCGVMKALPFAQLTGDGLHVFS